MAERRQAWEWLAEQTGGVVCPPPDPSPCVAVKFTVDRLQVSSLALKEATGVLALSFDGTLESLDLDGEGLRPEHALALARYYMLLDRLSGHDVQHDRQTDAARIVEIFFNDERISSPHYPANAVVVTLRYHDDTVWSRVVSGELTGFSFEAPVMVEIQTVEMVIPAEQLRTQEAA